jgi:uncharacterized protein YgbK (DUF1537 family)
MLPRTWRRTVPRQRSDPGLAIGCIADDFTGGTDLASTLKREGMRVVQMTGLPRGEAIPADVDAIVVSLKTRTAAVESAVSQSLEALRWLRSIGALRILFKYCSTFDSRDDGNIGPVADALLDELDAGFSIACPAFPETGRTVYQGHLFVNGSLLEHTSMARHPLTPMTDSNLLHLLGRQTSHRVGLVPYPVVRRGRAAIRSALDRLARSGHRYAIVDALEDRHLRAIAEAAADLPLMTGGSGIARGIPDALRRRGLLVEAAGGSSFRPPRGPSVVLAGSVSEATRLQLANAADRGVAICLDPIQLAAGSDHLEQALKVALSALGARSVLIHSANGTADVERAQQLLGRDTSARLVEQALSTAAVRLVEAGARRLVVAGGETSAAVVDALEVRALEIGPEIAPGVPWCVSLGEPTLALALKSGNFGGPDFLRVAFEALD